MFNTRYGKVGLLICHDRHYPEGARALALNGAEIVLIPSATPDKSLSRKVWEKELCAHAIFNEYFVAGLNRAGQEGAYLYYGKSVAFDPAGEMLAQAGPDEEVLIVDCDLDLITQRRRAWQFYRDRRPDTLRHTDRAGALTDVTMALNFHCLSSRGEAADLGFTRDRHHKVPKSAIADLGGREPATHTLGSWLRFPDSRLRRAPE